MLLLMANLTVIYRYTRIHVVNIISAFTFDENINKIDTTIV